MPLAESFSKMAVNMNICAVEQRRDQVVATQTIQLRTAAWYGDIPIELALPGEWDVNVLTPQTPLPLSEEEIREILEHPVGQPPIGQMCQGKKRPLIIIDDLIRPTPVARVMPFLLKQFQEASVPAQDIRILVATGTHGASPMESILKKVGVEAAAACRVIVHQCNSNLTKLGMTSSGTPVLANNEVVTSDCVVGIGGIYPNYTAGYGGGSKLALGVLGLQSIRHLHFRYRSLGWGRSDSSGGFRRDLDEIARMIGLNTLISIQVNADREAIRIDCGNHLLYYRDAVAFARQTCVAPKPADADVIISNAYPSDVSLTFARMKGTTPLFHCPAKATRIAIAACSEGFGSHGLFPLENKSRLHRAQQIFWRLSAMGAESVAKEMMTRVRSKLRLTSRNSKIQYAKGMVRRETPVNPIWLYHAGKDKSLPSTIRGMQLTDSWRDILQAVHKEQSGRMHLKAFVYTCAPLQSLD